ncbi:hypothetical protein [Crenobacter caeni]|uniref:Uncharacterized protein n=1 Tax=Crenobacter caeni TaxID=2705474 RepID=A0A6B2KV12_9NEIS|nr:hypothetical protein [Crenobacter caeni]NDV13843.1 hypothetical protein [Crenobacter caeni]
MHHRLLDPGSFMRAGWRLAQNPRLRHRAARRRARLPLPDRLFYRLVAPPLWLFLHAALAVLIVLFLLMPVFWLLDLT